MEAIDAVAAAVENEEVPAKKSPVTATPSTLSQALLRARKSVKSTVCKSEKNKEQGYSYLSHEQVIVSGARDALLDHGLSLEQRSVTYAGELPYETRGGRKVCWRWVGVFALVHETGEQEYAYEATTQPNDKAAYVASTMLEKVALLRVLQLAGTDEVADAERDYHDDTARRDQQRYAPQQPAQQPPQGRPADRTADPPGRVARLQTGPQGRPEALPPEFEAAAQMFRPKLLRLRTFNDLAGWLVDMKCAGYSDEIESFLWRIFRQRAQTLNFNANSLAEQAHLQLDALRRQQEGEG